MQPYMEEVQPSKLLFRNAHPPQFLFPPEVEDHLATHSLDYVRQCCLASETG